MGLLKDYKFNLYSLCNKFIHFCYLIVKYIFVRKKLVIIIVIIVKSFDYFFYYSLGLPWINFSLLYFIKNIINLYGEIILYIILIYIFIKKKEWLML